MHGLFDRYAARPTEALFDSVFLCIVSGGEDDETEVTSGRLPR